MGKRPLRSQKIFSELEILFREPRLCLPSSTHRQILLTFAGHVVIPVHERAIGVLSPGPDMEFEECGQAIPVWAIDQLKRLALQHRRTVMARHPSGRIYDKFNTYEPQAVSHGLIDQRFRLRSVNFAVSYQPAVDVMNAHGTMIRTTDTTEKWPVFRLRGGININEAARSVANDFHEPRRHGVLVTCMRLPGILGSTSCGQKRCGQGKPAQHHQRQDVYLRFLQKSIRFVLS